jgi:hypothetical protein
MLLSFPTGRDSKQSAQRIIALQTFCSPIRNTGGYIWFTGVSWMLWSKRVGSLEEPVREQPHRRRRNSANAAAAKIQRNGDSRRSLLNGLNQIACSREIPPAPTAC